MKKHSRVVTALIATLLVGGTLVGCGNQSKNSSQASSTSKASSSAASSAMTSSATSSSSSSQANSSTKITQVDDQTVGTMVALLKNPDWFKEYVNDGTMYYGKANSDFGKEVAGYSMVTANGDSTSFIYYKNDGTNVEIKTWDGDQWQTTNVSLAQLEKDYYVTSSQKQEVQGYVQQLKPYSEAND